MKIAYLLDTFPSSSETFLAREIEALRRHGFEIEVFAFHAGMGAREIPQSWLDKLSPRRWPNVGQNLDLRAFDHVHAGWANHLALVAHSAAKRANIPWSFSAHARDLWVEGGDLKAKLTSARFATSCTLAGTRELQKFGSNVLYSPHGLELKRYKFRPWKHRERVRIVGVGRLVAKKGWPFAYEAVRNLNEHLNPLLDGKTHARLVLIGDGPMREKLPRTHLESERKKRGYWSDDIIRLHGALPHAQTIKVMRRCDCLILPSLRTSDGDRDGLANVLLEAAALGLPIVTTDAGSASDFVDETTGILVEAGDLDALTLALARVFEQPEQTRWRCENARRRVEESFDVNRNIEVLVRAFRGQL